MPIGPDKAEYHKITQAPYDGPAVMVQRHDKHGQPIGSPEVKNKKGYAAFLKDAEAERSRLPGHKEAGGGLAFPKAKYMR